MPNDYCTVDELKMALPDSGMSDEQSYNILLRALITRASRLIDTETKRKPGAYYVPSTDEETRYYTGSGTEQQWIDELTAAPSAVGLSEGGGVQSTDYTTIPSSDFFLWPDNAAYEGKPYLRLDLDTINGAYGCWYRYRRSVKVTGPFGYSATVPDWVKQACITQASRWYKRGQQGFQDYGANNELGQPIYKKLDVDVLEMIAHYRRVTV